MFLLLLKGFLLYEVLCQNIINIKSTFVNEYGWCALDNRFNAYCGKNGFMCEDVYYQNSEQEYVIDYHHNLIWKHSKYINIPDNLIRDHSPLAANSQFMYLNFEKGVKIYETNFWTVKENKPTLSSFEIAFLGHQTTKWVLGDNGLYSFLIDEQGNGFLTQQSIDGLNTLWNISLPVNLLVENDPHVCECESTVYISSTGLLSTIDSSNGNILKQWSIDGIVNAIGCSSDSVFLLYHDSQVVQYSFRGNYIFSYQIPNKQLPKYNQILISNGKLTYVLCDKDILSLSCENPIIISWSIIENPEISRFTYSRITKLESQRSFEMRDAGKESIVRKVRYSKVSFDVGISSNTDLFLNLASHDNTGILTIAYLSGENNMQSSVCSGMSLHYLNMTGFEQNNPIVLSYHSVSLEKEFISYIYDYSSVTLQIGDVWFYIIHGGLNCKNDMVFADMYVIQINPYQLYRISPNNSIA